jgi:hypothetical protein
MPKMTAQTTDYVFSLAEIKTLICRELNVPEVAVSVSYSLQDMSDDDRYSSLKVSNIKVTVDNTKI